MPVLTMAAIDVLRAEANRLIEASRSPMSEEEHFNYRCTIEGVERQIDLALRERQRMPACPFCVGGKFFKTPTEGRLECDVCKAMLLRGWR